MLSEAERLETGRQLDQATARHAQLEAEGVKYKRLHGRAEGALKDITAELASMREAKSGLDERIRLLELDVDQYKRIADLATAECDQYKASFDAGVSKIDQLQLNRKQLLEEIDHQHNTVE